MLDLLGLEIISTNETEEAELDNNAPSIEEVALQCGFVLIVEDCLVTSFAYVLDFACYLISLYIYLILE
jgi:hypothetical protein